MSSLSQLLKLPDVGEPVWRLSIEQYHQMRQQGILTEADPIELLEGLLIQKMTKNPPHRIATRLVREVLESFNLAGWYVETQEPISTMDSEPEPDVAVIRGNTRDYLDCHPGAADVALVIEVADSTLGRDRSLKKRLYARAGIANYWIVNLTDRRLEVYTNPLLDDYQTQQTFPVGTTAKLAIVPDVEHVVMIDRLFP
jgi:Uma2 family endonuclease